MTTERRSLDSFLQQSMQTKTASAPQENMLLSKLASECAALTSPATNDLLNASGNHGAAGVAPEIVAATNAAYDPAVAMAGGDLAGMEAGSQPSQGAAAPVTVGDGTGDIDEDMALVNNIINGAGVNNVSTGSRSVAKVASLTDAVQVGRAMARGYQAELAKMAADEDFDEAVGILKSAGILSNYQFIGETEKNASESEYEYVGTPCLDKIAGAQALTKDDIVGAAVEFLKIASDHQVEQQVEQQYEAYAEAEKLASEEGGYEEFMAEETAKIASEIAVELVQELGYGVDDVKTASSDDDVAVAYAILQNAGIVQ